MPDQDIISQATDQPQPSPRRIEPVVPVLQSIWEEEDLFAYFFLERNRQKKTFRNQNAREGQQRTVRNLAALRNGGWNYRGEIKRAAYLRTHSAGDFGGDRGEAKVKDGFELCASGLRVEFKSPGLRVGGFSRDS